MPMAETFFARRFAMLKDRFGTSWMIFHERAAAQANEDARAPVTPLRLSAQSLAFCSSEQGRFDGPAWSGDNDLRKRPGRFQQVICERPMNEDMSKQFTGLQGQYLAYIALYTKLHRRSPAEADLREYFGVTPPSVHSMILRLEKRGLIARTPGRARSIEVLVPRDELPDPN